MRTIKKTFERNNSQKSPGVRIRIAQLAVGAVLLAAANVANAQLNQGTAKTWTSGAGDYKFGSAANWNPSSAPASGSGDIAIWDGNTTANLSGNVLQVTNAAANSSNPGMTLQVTANHTMGLTLVSSANALRLGTNSLVIASGSGPVSLGNGGANSFPVALALGGGNANYFTNNSTFPATINSDVNFTMGGGNLHYITLCGSGSWNINNNWAPVNNSGGSQDQMIINCAGTVTYAPTNLTGITYAAPFSGITLNTGTFKLGNAWCLTNLSGTLTLNGGTFDINGISITNNLSGAANIDTSAVGGTPTLTVSNASSTTFSGTINNTAGTLSLAKLGVGTLTLSGANTYSGPTTVNAGTLVVNGSIGSATVTVASGAFLGGTGTIGGNVNWQSGSLALFTVTATSGTNATYLKVTGNLTLNNNGVTINVAGSPLPIGTYKLVVAGAGSTGQFVTTLTSANYTGAGVASGTLSSIATSGGVATLTVAPAGTTTTWASDLAGGTGNWSVAANWASNPYAPTNAGDSATLGVGTAVSTVVVDENISLGGITFTNPNSFIIADSGKTITMDNHAGGAAIGVINGTSNAITSAMSLNDKTAINVSGSMSLAIAGIISGTSGADTLTKNGNGTLVLSGNNTYGPSAGSIGTLFNAGTLEITNGHALGAGDVTNSANATLRFDTAMSVPNKLWLSSASTLTLDDQGNTVSLTGGFGGSGSLTKSSGGWDIIANNGTSTIATLGASAGVLEIASGSTVQASGQCFVDNTNTLLIDSGATLNFNASAYGFVGNTTGVITTNIIYGTFNYSNANFVVARSGGGNMTINSGRFLCNNFFDGQSSASDSGYVFLNGGSLVVNNVQSGGGANYFYFNGGALVAKAASTTFWADSANLNASVQGNPGTIDNGGNAITISQPINSDTGTDGGMIFRGTNITTLASANGYNGPTVINGGTLLITGSIGSGNVTVASGAALGGTGSVGGMVNWQTGSSAYLMVTNDAGNNDRPFSVSGSVTLHNNSVIINVAGSSPLPVGIYTLMYSGGISSGHFATTPIYTGAGVAGGTVSTVTDDGSTVTLSVSVGGNTWTHDGNGNWSTAADWSGNPIIPRLPGDSAVLGVGSSLITIALDTNVAVGGISFTNPNSFVLANGGRTLTLSNLNGSAAINVSGGVSNAIAAPVVLGSPVIVTETGAGTLGLSGGLTGIGSLMVGGDNTGTLTLSGSNTYSGGTTISGGVLALGSTNALGTNVLVINGGELDSIVTNLVNANNNPQIWMGSFGFAGSNNLNLGTGSVSVSNALTLSVTNSLVIGGTINASSVTVTLNGSGTLELDGNNSFGSVNSGVGTLVFGNDYAAGTGYLYSYSPTAAFASSSSATRTIHNTLATGNGAFGWIFTGPGNLVFDGGVNSYNFAKTVAVSNAVTTWKFALPSGAASTTKIGPGNLVFAGANANTGGNIVNEGTLTLADPSALGTGTLTMNGGNLDSSLANLTNINNNAQTWNTNFMFLGSQSLNLGNGAVTMAGNIDITVAANTLEVDGAITDSGSGYSLSVDGAGTFRIGDPGSLDGGSYSGLITNNGTFSYASSSAQTLSGVVSGTGTLIKSGSSVLTLSGINTYTGNTIVQAGTLELVNPVLYTNSTLAISNGAAVQLDFIVTNLVGKLVLNGIAQPGGVYGASTPGGYITGNGFVQVASAGPTGPAHLTNTVSGSTLSLSWPAGQNWRLQMQTNSLARGLGTNWIYLTDGSLSSTNITLDPTKPAVFYRLTYP